MTNLRAGIIGVGGYGAGILAALENIDLFSVTAIADQNRELAHDLAQRHEAASYDDYRSLIVQEPLDVLFLALPTFMCRECLNLAAKKKLHVFKTAPLARSLPEATEWIKLFKKSQTRFQIDTPNRFAPGYLDAHQKLAQKRLGQIYLAQVQLFLQFEGDFSWRGDPVLAGGGVLLEEAYNFIDLLLWNLGTPESIYSLNTAACSRRTLPPYRTEDTAVVTMKFPNGTIGNLTCSWMSAPRQENMLFCGTDGRMELTPNSLKIFDTEGKLITNEQFQTDPQWILQQQIRHFADSLLDEQIEPVAPAGEHLANVAVIESAYLSARTQMPENLKVYGNLFDLEP